MEDNNVKAYKYSNQSTAKMVLGIMMLSIVSLIVALFIEDFMLTQLFTVAGLILGSIGIAVSLVSVYWPPIKDKMSKNRKNSSLDVL
jgi:hypothetical protein